MKININGQEVEAKEIEVLSSVENWSEYKLSDGNIIKAKVVAVRIIRMDGLPKLPDGMPQYQVINHVVVGAREG
jgi:hypothetical protein